ncbi:MAG: hypothetical protein KAI43_11460 [Candidatus Aureabacteria bacterium]|nr:hypothetical protein [Candidatus Auribacterota bacterium]
MLSTHIVDNNIIVNDGVYIYGGNGIMFKNMTTKKTIIVYELVGFLIVIVLLWLDEIFDIPHNLLGATATPINWVESIFETVIVLVFCAFVTFFSWQSLKRIKYLERFLFVCSFCKKIRFEKEWIPIEDYIREHSESEFSHSLCPECAKKHYGNFLKNEESITINK